VILDIVISMTRWFLRNVGPSLSVVLVHRDKYGFLIVSPLSLFEFRIQVVLEPLLLSLSSG
jgi:hypothetical protein